MTRITQAATGLGAIQAVAAAPTFAQDGFCFAAGSDGLRVSTDGGITWRDAYATLGLRAPLTTAALAFSPSFAQDRVQRAKGDRTIFAGAVGGVLRSHDEGQTWRIASLPSPPPFVTALAVSPHYLEDGLVFAGTMEDGVLRSWDRGDSWAAWNFGLLDLNVYALAISPEFARDDTLYVGVDSGVFRSSNGGRAWRETSFPMECAPVLSLAISPNFAADGVIFAGTEASGLWMSADRGVTWRGLAGWETPGPINALMLAPTAAQQPSILAVTDAALCLSQDGGASWQVQCSAELRGVTCAAAPAGVEPSAQVLLGTGDGRVLVCAL
ncbi:MAG: hypothetical protein KJZ95_01950 [Caldilinea sp.]|nr:hypothetical protein [Caldilinea sp.]